MGEQERRFFHALCYAVGAEKALLQAVLRARIWRGKGFIPYADIEAGLVGTVIVKDMSRLGRNYLQVGMYTEWNGTRATP